MDQVLGLAAIYSAVRIIADMIASLPVNVYRYDSNGVPVKLPSSQLLDSPSVTGTLYDWLFMGTASALLHGNGIGYITSRTGVPAGASGLGLPATIEWLPMERVHIQDDEAQPWNPLRAKFFFDGRQLEREEIVHLRAFVVPGRTAAISPLRAFATLISQGLGALDYSETWYKNGGFPPGTFQNTAEEVDRQQATEIRQRLTDTLRTHQPLVYGRDWEYKAISIPPNEAAFVESMQLNATQVAAIYGLPPERIGGKRGDSLTYSTEQQEVLAIITDTLRPWLVRWEQLLKTILPNTQFAKFDVDQLLKTDLKTRYEIFGQQLDMGIRTADEIRRQDDLPGLPGDVGKSTIPLKILERMAATTRAIPKAILNEVVLEQELAAELLLKLQALGVVAPDDPGEPQVKAGPLEYLGRQLTLSRAAPLPAREKHEGDLGGHNTPFGPHHQRATHADRRRAHAWITGAHASGALDDDELHERVTSAANAKVKGDLGDLVKDLPSEKELAAAGKQLADAPPNQSNVRSGNQPQHLYGQEAVTVLREMQFRWDQEPDALASLNGKAH